MLCDQQMEYNAALERALGIYTVEYPRLNAMLEEMRAAMSDEANTPVAEVRTDIYVVASF
jgi:hypothetical protein